jgi:hypothetical protein
VIAGTDRRLPPLIIGAHYDSVIAAPSADDNAAAVAIALSSATALGATPRARDIVIALFDAEEPPYILGPDMGSVRFCASQTDAPAVHAALVLDLVGHGFTLPGRWRMNSACARSSPTATWASASSTGAPATEERPSST